LFRYSLKDPAAKIDPLKMLKKEIQQQLESIEQTANAYFDKVEAYEDFHDFDSLDSDDRARSSELHEQIASVVGELFDATEHSARFDESDQLALRDGNHQADSALRFRKYRRSSSYVPHDEGSPLGFIPGESWEELTDISSARQEFEEGLAAIGRILMLVPDGGHKEADNQDKPVLTRKEFAEKIGRDPRTVKRYVDKGIIKANQTEAGRILSIPRSELDSFLKKRD